MEYKYERRLGFRRLAGTDWPVDAVVYGSSGDWIGTVICNGISTFHNSFTTLQAAKSWVDALEATQ